MKVTIPDYGCGNLASVVRMIEKVGGRAEVSARPDTRAEKLIIAGVGAFDHGMRSLTESGWADALQEAVLQRGVPVLGICLGMQLLCNSSEEGQLPGLRWIDAAVHRFEPDLSGTLKIPHMGWNTVRIVRPNTLLTDAEGEQRFYFVHSYRVTCANPGDVVATAHHGADFVAALGRGHIYGVQFHPEKSHRFGMALLQKFVQLRC